MENNLLEIGKIVNTHGIRGEVKIQPLSLIHIYKIFNFLLTFRQFNDKIIATVYE